jgi:hypothetical protein
VIPEPETGDHLVEYEHGAVRAREVAQLLQIFAGLDEQSIVRRHGLDDRGRDVLALLAEGLLERGDVAERDHERIGGHLGRNAGAVRQALRDDAAACLHHQRIDVAVVAAIELEDAPAAIGGARNAHRGRNGFRAAHDESHQLRVGIGGEHSFRKLSFAAMGRSECEAIGGCLLNRLDDTRMRVAEDERTPRHAEVEVPVSVLVRRVRAFRLAEEHRRSAHLAEGTHRTRHTSRNQRFSARVKLG